MRTQFSLILICIGLTSIYARISPETIKKDAEEITTLQVRIRQQGPAIMKKLFDLSCDMVFKCCATPALKNNKLDSSNPLEGCVDSTNQVEQRMKLMKCDPLRQVLELSNTKEMIALKPKMSKAGDESSKEPIWIRQVCSEAGVRAVFCSPTMTPEQVQCRQQTYQLLAEKFGDNKYSSIISKMKNEYRSILS